MTDFSRLSRFGMTFEPLTENLGEVVLTWCLVDSLARTSALQAKEPASMASDLDSGRTWRELWARYNPDTSSWKTLQCSLFADLEELSPTWPRSGMVVDGECWALPMLAQDTSETDSGLWPTPTKFDAHTPSMMPRNGDTTRLDVHGKARKVLADGRTASMGLSRLVIYLTKRFPTAMLFENIMLWPTGWTGLAPLGMDKSHCAPQQHGTY
jgi:hypothetical protein